MAIQPNLKNNIAALRKVLRECSGEAVEGMVILKTDPHQNEYLPACFERLRWVTGFTGSAGVAIVLQHAAALFVDGRYSLQAREEVDPSLFEIEPLKWSTIKAWIKKNLSKGHRLGYDPWLTLSSQRKILEEACVKAQGTLVSLINENPIDMVWRDRPPLIHQEAMAHPLIYAGKSTQEKLTPILTSMKEENIDTLILTKLASIAWLLNIRGRDIVYNPLPLAYALVNKNETIDLFLGGKSLSKEEQRCLDLDARVKIHAYGAFQAALKTLNEQKVWVDPSSVSVGVFEALEKEKVHFYKVADPCVLPKACKNFVEIQGAREAHIRDGVAVTRFLAWLDQEVPKGGVTEGKAAKVLLEYRQDQSLFQQPSFETISAFEEHGAIVHYRVTSSTDKKLHFGGLYLVDSGGQYLDGTTDITRTIALGGNPSLEKKEAFTRVLKGHIALAQVQFPKGTTGHQLDALARQYLWEIGLDYAHGTGHGVGSYLNVHEDPQSISPYPNQVPLEPGMLLSNEPGYYKEGAYGIRIENIVLVKESSMKGFLEFETLTVVPFDLSLIEFSLLTSSEKKWITAYHRQIVQILSPYLDAVSKKWLEKYVKN